VFTISIPFFIQNNHLSYFDILSWQDLHILGGNVFFLLIMHPNGFGHTTSPSLNCLVCSQQRSCRSTPNNSRTTPSIRSLNKKQCPFSALGRTFLRCRFGVNFFTKFNSKTCHMMFLSSSHKYKNNVHFVAYNKVYHNKLILIIFIL
jgi:hypothetical protein